jgi:hypothetical protein
LTLGEILIQSKIIQLLDPRVLLKDWSPVRNAQDGAALLRGLPEILPRLRILLVAAAFLLLGYITFRVSVRRAKREDTLKWG